MAELPTGPVRAKVGTQPWMVVFDRRGKLRLDARVRFKEWHPRHGTSGQKSHTGTITCIDPIKLSL